MNNAIRLEKRLIAKTYTTFPKQRNFAKLFLLLQLEHHRMKRKCTRKRHKATAFEANIN